MISGRESAQQAKNYAFLLLKFRPRSEKEIYQRLRRKRFQDEIIKQTLFFLKDKRFVDDEVFAATWIDSRIKKPLGLRKIREELRLKGIAKEIIDRKIREAKDCYCEQAIIEKIAKAKFSKLKDIESRKAKKRVYAYLLRRGFSPEIVIDVINQI